MTDQVSVRLAVVGGSQFRNELNQAGTSGAQAMGRLQTATRGVPTAFNAVGIQAAAMASRMAGAGPAASALSGALGMAVISAGTFGLAGGAVVAVLGAMVPLLLRGRTSAAEMAAEMTSLEGSTGSVNSAMSALAAVQKQYAEATRAQGGASSAAATAVVSASKREFNARKEVLAVELELLRIRGAERKSELAELQSSLNEEFRRFETLRQETGKLDPVRQTSIRDVPGAARDGITRGISAQFSKDNEQAILGARKLRAEAELLNIELARGEAALAGQFKDIAGGLTLGGAAGGGGGGGGGGQGSTNKLLEEGKRLFDQTRNAAEKYAAEMAKLNELLKAGAIDQDTYNRRAAQLQEQFQSTGKLASDAAGAFKSSLGSLFDAIVEGGGKAGDVIEDLGKKLASMALQTATFQLLARLAPGVFGAGGTIPLLANANGNAFSGGRVTAFARGGVVSGATMFGMRGGMGMMGEAGPEAIMPLTRIGGKLGVASSGGGGQVVQIIDQRGAGAPAIEREQRSGPDGREMVILTVREATARGDLDGAQRGRFGASAAKVRR